LLLPPFAEKQKRGSERCMLASNSAIRYALISDTEAEGNNAILTLGIRDLGMCALAIPKAKYDPFLIMGLLNEHEGTLQ
jgi:hypothetical protein